MIAGIMLLSMKEVKLGDIIQIKVDSTEYFGRVEEINIRTTTVRTFDMKQVVLPNIKLIESPIQTYSSEEIVRLETLVEVHYNTDLEQATQVFLAAVNSCNFIADPSRTVVLTDSFGASGIAMKCLFFVDPNCGWSIPQIVGYVNHVIINYARANHIKIPYPHTTLQADTGWKDLLTNVNTLAGAQ